MIKQFTYNDCKHSIKLKINAIAVKKPRYKNLKDLLLLAKKNKYLAANIASLKANKKSDREKILAIAETFCNLKLVTQKTIKTRGWTDKLIKTHLNVDIWANNPYYKSSGMMRLYCLSRVVQLELEPDIAKAIATNLSRRQKLAATDRQRLSNALFKWLEAIGDPYIAIALLLRLLNKAIKSVKDYDDKQDFYKLKDKALQKLKPFLAQTFIARKNLFDNKNLYCHWFDVNGYKLSFHSYSSLGYEGDFSLEQYNIKFGSKLNESDKKLLFKLSGWRSIPEAIKGLDYLISCDYLGGFNITSNLTLFTPAQYPEPPTEDDLFVLKVNRDREYMKRDFDRIIKEIRSYKSNGCPFEYSCKLMGAVNDSRCANYRECMRAFSY